MVTRILASWYLTKQDSGYPAISVTAKGGGSGRNVQTANHTATARAVARDGIVLLKNSGNLLPLQKPKSIAIIGSGAVANPQGINSCIDFGCDTGTLVQGWGSGSVTLPVSFLFFCPCASHSHLTEVSLCPSRRNNHPRQNRWHNRNHFGH